MSGALDLVAIEKLRDDSAVLNARDPYLLAEVDLQYFELQPSASHRIPGSGLRVFGEELIEPETIPEVRALL
ncbi:hypothetical protein [Streptomyces sp. NPDC002156]